MPKESDNNPMAAEFATMCSEQIAEVVKAGLQELTDDDVEEILAEWAEGDEDRITSMWRMFDNLVAR